MLKNYTEITKMNQSWSSYLLSIFSNPRLLMTVLLVSYAKGAVVVCSCTYWVSHGYVYRVSSVFFIFFFMSEKIKMF